jgi:hypothetical protein
VSRCRWLLAALFTASFPALASGQARPAAAPVTVAVRVGLAEAGAYQLAPAAGVRAVTPLTGRTDAGELPLTFFLPPTLAAGRQQIATLILPGAALPVWYDVPERRDLRVTTAADVELAAGTAQRLTFTAQNLGNVSERASVLVSGVPLGVRAAADSVTIPAGGTAPVPVTITVPRDARPGTTYLVRIALSAGALTPRGHQRVTVAARRNAAVPVQVGAVGALDGSATRAWVAADLWMSDSVRLQAETAKGQAWTGLAPSRAPGFRLTAPGWRVAAGEVTLPRPTELIPWVTGTGARVELGRSRGWTIGGSWIHDEPGAGAAALLAASLRLSRLQLGAGVLSVERDAGRVVLPTVGLGAWGARARGDLAVGVLHSGSVSNQVGHAQGQLNAGAARMFGAWSHTRTPDLHDATGDVASTSATAGVDVRLTGGSSLFVTAAVSSAGRDSAGTARTIAAGSTVRAGARLRSGAFALLTGAEVRRVGVGARERAVHGVTTSLSWGGVRGLRFRSDAGWERVATVSGTAGRTKGGAELVWTGAPGFISLSATYGSGALSAEAAPALRAQLQTGLRASWGSLDASTLIEHHSGGALTQGSASASLRIRPETDLLVGIRRMPGLVTPAEWEIALGIRSTLAVPFPQRPDRRVVFEDVNGNGRRDRGEQGVPGLPLHAAGWTGVTDGAGRFVAPGSADVLPDLAVLGGGWRVGTVTGRAIPLVRGGSVEATAYFADLHPDAVERVPSGSVVLVGPSGVPIAAELAPDGTVRWSDLPGGRYRVYHVSPAVPQSGVPSNAVPVDLLPGGRATVRVPASYAPRLMTVRRLDGGLHRDLAPMAERSAGDTPAGSASSPRPEHGSPPPGAECPSPTDPETGVRPGMSEPEVRCALGAPRRVSRRGPWTYWFYGRSPAGAGGAYDDIVFFREGTLVTAVLREPGRLYQGPPPHQQLVEALRGGARVP